MAEQTEGARDLEFPKPSEDEEIVANAMRLKRITWRRLKRVAEVEGESQTAAAEFLLSWALDDWDATRARKGDSVRSTDPLDEDEDDAPKKKKPKSK